MKTKPFLLHALSPLHAGTGQAVGVIDLPIARLKATGIPYLPGSSIKGVLRDSQLPGEDVLAAFGPEPRKEPDNQHAGAIAFTDARLLLLPVRSLRGTFAWVTSPLLLRLALEDLPALSSGPAGLGASQVCVSNNSPLLHGGKVYLEEIDLTRNNAGTGAVTALGTDLTQRLFGQADPLFQERLAVVDDETMTFLWETATQIDARNRIDRTTGIVADGQLWYEESLPAESVLIGLAAATKSRREGHDGWTPERFLETFVKARGDLQFGGKSTIGRGRMRLIPQEMR
jgi:CRISPR-associated protein Cmr4